MKVALVSWLVLAMHIQVAGQKITISIECPKITQSFFEYSDFCNDQINLFDLMKRSSYHSGERSFEIDSPVPVYLNFSRNFVLFPVYLLPGDSIEVKECNNQFVFGGNRSNEELLFLNRYERLFSFTFFKNDGIRITNRLNFDFVRNQTEKDFRLGLDYLAESHRNGIISDRYFELLKVELEYKKYNELLFPFSPTRDSIDVRVVPPNYYRFLKDHMQGLVFDSLLFLRQYRLFVRRYNYFLSYSKSGRKPSDMELFACAAESFPGATREFLQFSLLKNLYAKGFPETVDLSREFIDSGRSSIFSKYIDSLSRRSDEPLPPNVLFSKVEAISGVMDFGEVLSSFAGKVIYLDFWASWCGPCIEEIPFSIRLADKLKGEDVEFVFISLDDDPVKWRKSIFENFSNLEFFHCRLIDGSLKDFFPVPPLPRYMVLSKERKVVANDAPRPSDADLLRVLRYFSAQE